MTTKSTPKIAARRKIAAAVLALGAGVLGCGFAAGVIDVTPGTQSGFGTGDAGTGFGNQLTQIDITGSLEVNRPAESDFAAASSKSPYQMTQGDEYTVSGFEEIAAAHPGATYHVSARAASGNWIEVATGTVTADTVVTVPVTNANGAVSNIAVSIEK